MKAGLYLKMFHQYNLKKKQNPAVGTEIGAYVTSKIVVSNSLSLNYTVDAFQWSRK